MKDLGNSNKQVRVELAQRLRARRSEIERRVFARVSDSAAGLQSPDDPEYVAGLREAIAAGIEYGLCGIEAGEASGGPPPPPQALAQAQLAARSGVGSDAVNRRYVIGSGVLNDCLIEEGQRREFDGVPDVVREASRILNGVLERLIEAVNTAYTAELARSARSPEQRRAERVQRLLAGGEGSSAEIAYELDARHLGVIANGPDAAQTLVWLAGEVGSALLCVRRGEQSLWAWLGGGRAPAARDFQRALSSCAPGAVAHSRADCGSATTSFAVGEPAEGLEGWRLTHQQAQAALRVALREPRPVTRYAEVALLAAMLCDEGLSRSFVQIYLAPLGEPANGGAVLRETLRAYFAAERNASSAASALGVGRHAVESRLRTIEERLGQSLRTRQAELEVALRLEELDAHRAGFTVSH